jgi:hypothetical protein
MFKEQFVERFMIPPDSNEVLPQLGWREKRRFVRLGRELGVRAIYGARIHEQNMSQREPNLSVRGIVKAVDVDQRFLDDPNVFAGPYIVITKGKLGRRNIHQIPGVMLYAMEDENVNRDQS